MTADRVAFTAALRELADFLDANPDAPLPMSADVSPYVSGSDAERRAEVDRIAAVLGVKPFKTPVGGLYRVKRRFGDAGWCAGITYSATAVLTRDRQQWEATQSYADSVTP